MTNHRFWRFTIILAAAAFAGAFSPGLFSQGEAMSDDAKADKDLATATFGSGCFWCTEAVFERVKGVSTVTSGYSGGQLKNPTYEQVISKKSGHAEVVQLTYDPETISFKELLEISWKTHDPTTVNRQGNDIGPQYRSVVFFHDEEQRQLAARRWVAAGGYGPNCTRAHPFRGGLGEFRELHAKH